MIWGILDSAWSQPYQHKHVEYSRQEELGNYL